MKHLTEAEREILAQWTGGVSDTKLETITQLLATISELRGDLLAMTELAAENDTDAGRAQDERDKLRERNERLTAALKRTDEYLEGLSSGREMGTDMKTASEKGKRYAHQIQIEIREALAGEAMSADPVQPSHAPETKAAESEGGQPK